MFKKYCYICFLIVVLSACNPVRKIFEGGKIQQTSFIEKIPFTFELGIPFITVTINGKNYKFMFDTGAPNVISPALAKSLSLVSQANEKISDSQGRSNREHYVVIPSIKIGNLNFEHTGALIIEPSEVFEFKCMKYDGIIGANLMAKATWQIDYRNQLITATHNIANFHIPAGTQTIPFIPQRWQKTPLVPIKIGNKLSYSTFDTGSNGDFTFSLNTYNAEISQYKSTESFGDIAIGIYGSGKASVTKHIKIPTMEVGELSLHDQIIDFSERSPNNLGNVFFKNYRVILSWNEHKIYMIKESTFNYNKLQTFGLALKYVNNKPKVSKIYRGSEAEISGIQINDELISVNGKDLTNLTEEEACFYAFNSILKTDNSSIALTILRTGKKINFTLQKATVLD